MATSSYILTLQLKTEKYQEDILNKRFNKCRNIYNSCISELYKRYNHMRESKAYQKNCKYKGKDRNKVFNELNKQYGLTEYSLYGFVVPMYNYYNIDSKTAQAMATRAFNAFQKLIFHQAKKVKYIKYNELYSIEGKTNAQGIKYRNGTIIWNKLNIPVIVRKNDEYTQLALQDRVKYCRIVRKEIKGKIKWYVQLVMEGIPPKKVNKNTGEIHSIGQGDVGIDIGTKIIAISSTYDCKLLELAPSINNIDKEIKLIQRRMDRSKRSTNPNKYNPNRTVNIKNNDKWIYSNKYLKLKSMYKELYRKQSAIRKQDHEVMSNYILSLGNKFYVETMNFKGLQARAKETTINSKGRYNKKKRFGKSLANKAPSMFLTILKNKVHSKGGKYIEVNTYKVKASQYNHLNQQYNKKKLSQRWNYFNYNNENIKVQRDIYSAFLIKNVEGLENVNNNKCNEQFEGFIVKHNREIERLQGLNNLSSIGV